MDLTVLTEVCTITGERASTAPASTFSSVRSFRMLIAGTPYRSAKDRSTISFRDTTAMTPSDTSPYETTSRKRGGLWGVSLPTDAQLGAGRVGCGRSASEFDAVVDLSVLGDEPGTLVDSELFAGTIGIDPEAGPSVALLLRVQKRV